MKKVTFSIKRRNSEKITGVGYITEEDLLIPAISRNNKPYIRVFEDCLKYCNKIVGKTNEYQGIYEMIIPCEIPDKNGSTETKELPISYYIWYKLIEE